MPNRQEAPTVVPPPEGMPVNPDRVVQNLLNQNASAMLSAAKWQALAEELMDASLEQQKLIKELQDQLDATPVHNGRTTTARKGAKSA